MRKFYIKKMTQSSIYLPFTWYGNVGRFPVVGALGVDFNEYVVALRKYATFNTIRNITEKNNKFTYSPTGAAPWFTVTFDSGTWGIPEINNKVQQTIQEQQGIPSTDPQPITIDYYLPTTGTQMEITGTYAVDFTVPNSINNLLGFNPLVYTAGIKISQNIANIMPSPVIYLTCSIVNGSLTTTVPKDGQTGVLSAGTNTILEAINIDSPPGYLLAKEVTQLAFLPTRGTPAEIVFTLVDANGILLDNGGEYFSCVLDIRKKAT